MEKKRTIATDIAVLDDLDIEIKNELLEQRKELCSKWKQNSAYDICFTNTDGTRYFKAKRVVLSWNDDKGHYMPFGGGTYWQIRYGKIKWTTEKKSNWRYGLCMGSITGNVFKICKWYGYTK